MAEVVAHEQVVEQIVEKHAPEDEEIPSDFDGDSTIGDGIFVNLCIDTPSEPGSPPRLCGRVGPSGYGNPTDGQGNMQGMQWVPVTGLACSENFNSPMAACGNFMGPCGVHGMGGWGVSPVMAAPTGCAQWMVPIAASPDTAQLGEQYSSCLPWAGDGQEASMLRKRLHESERQRTQMQRSWEREREGLMREIERYREVLLRYAIPVEEATDRTVIPPFEPKGQESDSNAAYGYNDYKANYDNYYKEDGYHGEVVEPMHTPTPTGSTVSTDTPGDESNSNHELSEDGATKIATQLKAMFPDSSVCSGSELEPRAHTLPQEHELCLRRRVSVRPVDTRRTGSMSKAHVKELAKKLETSTRCSIDERAMKVLQTLPVASALEALQKVDHLVESQGGSCDNLSSILQSMCRWVERKGPRELCHRKKQNNFKAASSEGPQKFVIKLEDAVPSMSTPRTTDESPKSNQALTPTTEDSTTAFSSFSF